MSNVAVGIYVCVWLFIWYMHMSVDACAQVQMRVPKCTLRSISLNWKLNVSAGLAEVTAGDFVSILEMLGLQVLMWSHLLFWSVF